MGTPIVHRKRRQTEVQAPDRHNLANSGLPLLMSPAEAARQLDLSRYTIYELIKRGELRSVRFSRLLRISRAELVRFASSLEQK